MSYVVGQQLKAVISVKDKASDALVDPGSLEIKLKSTGTNAFTAGTYTWNGTTWSSSESVVGVPSKEGTGLFELYINIPYANSAAGSWYIGWKSDANVSGQGKGSGFSHFQVVTSPVLP